MADRTTNLEPLLGVAEVAAIYGVPVSTVYVWRAKGVGPAGFRVGKHLKYRRVDVESHLASLREGGAPEEPADEVAR